LTTRGTTKKTRTLAPGRGASTERPRREHPRQAELPGTRRVLNHLHKALGKPLCDRYFERVAQLHELEDSLRVTVPSEFVAGVIDRRFGEALRKAAAGELGKHRVEYDIVPVVPKDDAPGNMTRTKPQRTRTKRAPIPLKSLDDFLPDECNKLALNAARSIASGEGTFSPLFVHGRCGMGKTHLLQGIAQEYRRTHPGVQVRYVTAESFTNAFLSAMRAGTLDSFREAYRGVGLLCLDDAHFLSAKRATQSEMLHTFDTIGLNKRLLVLASDEHPRDISKLDPGLASRFASGAVARLDPPGGAMCERLLVEFARRRDLVLEPTAIEQIIGHARRDSEMTGDPISIRAIEGLIVQVEAACRLLPALLGDGRRVGAALVAKAIGGESGVPSPSPRRPARIEKIIELTCAALGVSTEEFRGSHRHRRIVLARSLTVLLAREATNLSYPEIARAMGRPNHSTVITAYQRIDKQMAKGERVGTRADLDRVTIAALAERIRRELAREALSR